MGTTEVHVKFAECFHSSSGNSPPGNNTEVKMCPSMSLHNSSTESTVQACFIPQLLLLLEGLQRTQDYKELFSPAAVLNKNLSAPCLRAWLCSSLPAPVRTSSILDNRIVTTHFTFHIRPFTFINITTSLKPPVSGYRVES